MLGNTQEPGITSTVDSAPTVSSGDDSPGTPVIVGGADLTNGSAAANEVVGISRAGQARNQFGSSSRLTQSVIQALGQGASPVLAVATEATQVTDDIGGLGSQTGTLSAPCREDTSEFTVDVDGSTKTVSLVHEPVGSLTVPTGEIYVNPATKNFKLDAAPSTSGSIEFEALDYTAALDAVATYDGDVDFVGALKEDPTTVNYLSTTVQNMASEYQLSLGIAALEPHVDIGSFTNPFDTSRMQLFVPGRLASGASMVGAFIGMRAAIGLDTTAINQRLSLNERPLRSLSLTERGELSDKFVTPLATLGTSARVTDDLTTVSDQNSEEANYRYGFTRLAVDFLIETAVAIEEPFVGEYNKPGIMEVFADLLGKEARPLNESNVIYDQEVDVALVSPTEIKVTLQAEAAQPIRFIDNEFIIGDGL